MTQQTASNTASSFSSRSNHGGASSIRRSGRRAGLLGLAALGLPLGAILAPSTAVAAPGDSPDDMDIDLQLPLGHLLPLDDIAILLPLDVLPQPVTPGDSFPLAPIVPNPVPPIPIPFPIESPMPDDGPGPDDGPELPFDVPVLVDPFDLFPFDLDDLVLPTGPGDDDPEDPECAEYSAENFLVDAEHHEGDLIELRLMYADTDVCDFTVWTAVAEPGAVGVLSANTAGMSNIAFATDSAGYHQQTLLHHDLCDVEIRVAVEESVAFTVPHTDPVCEDEIPGPADDGDEPEDDGDEPEDDGDDPEDDGDDPGDDGDESEDDGDEPEDDGDEPGDDSEETPGEARPLGEPETPGTPSGGLPQTGTDMTTVMFAIGLMTLGAGSVVALATRRREEFPAA